MAKKPRIKTQEQLFQEAVTPYTNPETGGQYGGREPLDASKKRESQLSRKSDSEKNPQVGLQDIDEAIYHYITEIVKPRVSQNGTIIDVPVMYGTPENWASIQKDGCYRDRNGKMQMPLIVFSKGTVEKDRGKSNKLDGNKPHNYSISEVKYTRKNVYDRFDILQNRVPTKEYIAVAIPDYVTVTYECILFTDFVEQANSLIEAFNFASDSYWGAENKYQFQARIDSFRPTVEVSQGSDRVQKTTFQLVVRGYIIPDTPNAFPFNTQKFYSKSAVKVTGESVYSLKQENPYIPPVPVRIPIGVHQNTIDLKPIQAWTASVNIQLSNLTEQTGSYITESTLGSLIQDAGFAITGSNTFYGNQIISGSINVTGFITGSLPYVVTDVSRQRIQALRLIATDATGAEHLVDMVWNQLRCTWDWQLPGGVTGQMFQELHFYGKCQGAVRDTAVVQYVGAQGANIIIKEAVPSEINVEPELLLGVATQEGANNDFIKVTWYGEVQGVNTTGWEEGNILFFESSDGIIGGLTKYKPIAPAAIVNCAVVVKESTGEANNGIILVRPTFHLPIREASDVHMPSVQTLDVPAWNEGTRRFESYSLSNFIPTGSITSATGSSSTLVMSQKGITDIIGNINELLDIINGEII